MAQIWSVSIIWGGVSIYGSLGTKTFFGLSEEEAIALYLQD